MEYDYGAKTSTDEGRLRMLKELEIMEIMDRVARLSDDATISNDMTAIYLGVSPSSLSVMRQRGEGPAYMQYPSSGTKARNQKVVYKMGDVRSWRDSKKVSSTMEAAVVRGMAFGSILDLANPEPFWMSGNKVVSHGLDIGSQTFTEHLENDLEIVWMPISEAIKRIWTDRELFIKYNLKAVEVINNELEAYAISRDATILDAKVKISNKIKDTGKI